MDLLGLGNGGTDNSPTSDGRPPAYFATGGDPLIPLPGTGGVGDGDDDSDEGDLVDRRQEVVASTPAPPANAPAAGTAINSAPPAGDVPIVAEASVDDGADSAGSYSDDLAHSVLSPDLLSASGGFVVRAAAVDGASDSRAGLVGLATAPTAGSVGADGAADHLTAALLVQEVIAAPVSAGPGEAASAPSLSPYPTLPAVGGPGATSAAAPATGAPTGVLAGGPPGVSSTPPSGVVGGGPGAMAAATGGGVASPVRSGVLVGGPGASPTVPTGGMLPGGPPMANPSSSSSPPPARPPPAYQSPRTDVGGGDNGLLGGFFFMGAATATAGSESPTSRDADVVSAPDAPPDTPQGAEASGGNAFEAAVNTPPRLDLPPPPAVTASPEVIQMRTIFPKMSAEVADRVLAMNDGSVDRAMNYVFDNALDSPTKLKGFEAGASAAASGPAPSEEVLQLQEFFPLMPAPVIRFVLAQNENQVERAIQFTLEQDLSSPSTVETYAFPDAVKTELARDKMMREAPTPQGAAVAGSAMPPAVAPVANATPNGPPPNRPPPAYVTPTAVPSPFPDVMTTTAPSGVQAGGPGAPAPAPTGMFVAPSSAAYPPTGVQAGGPGGRPLPQSGVLPGGPPAFNPAMAPAAPASTTTTTTTTTRAPPAYPSGGSGGGGGGAYQPMHGSTAGATATAAAAAVTAGGINVGAELTTQEAIRAVLREDVEREMAAKRAEEEASRALMERLMREEEQERARAAAAEEQATMALLEQEREARQTELDNKLYDCGVCYSQLPLEEMYTLDACYHRYCFTCLRGFFEAKINDGETTSIICPTLDCDHVVEYAEVKHVVDDALFLKYEDFLLRKTLESDPNVCWCPRPGCGVAVISEQGRAMVVCASPRCSFSYCKNCLVEWHSGATCEEYQEWVIENSEAEARFAAWRQEHTKECPQCNTAIEKNGGCNHMTCRHCDHEFCWLCSETYTSSHWRNSDCSQYS